MCENMDAINVILVDDQEVFRKAMRTLISKIDGIQVIAEASNGLEFLDIIKTSKADVVLMDLQMPVMDGIVATKQALKVYPQLKIIALTIFRDYEYFKPIIDAGVCGYIIKDLVNVKLEQALRLAINDECSFFLMNK